MNELQPVAQPAQTLRTERKNQTLVVDDAGRLAHVGAADAAPRPGRTDTVLDYGELFVMLGP